MDHADGICCHRGHAGGHHGREDEPCPRPAASRGKRHTLLWGISGGTLLSIVGFIAMIGYQEYSESLHQLRGDLRNFNQHATDVVKKDELRNRTTALWTVIREMQAAHADDVRKFQAINLAAAGHEARLAEASRRVKDLEDERREMSREVQQLRERLACVEGRQAATAVLLPAAHVENAAAERKTHPGGKSLAQHPR
jgi:hypothetical protein